MSISILQLQKRDSYEFKYIQDKYAYNQQNRAFALADGTTQSFNSELWAEIITSQFVNNPKFNSNELISLFSNNVSSYKNSKIEFSNNPAKASLEKAKQSKGGTATFIGLQFNSENKIDIISCGDSNLFLLNSKNEITTFPFTDVDNLDANNHFINTEQLLQNNIDDTFFRQESLTLNHDDVIILATDALSRLILKKPSIIKELLNIETFEHLHNFCLKYWKSKELQEDDISAILIPTAKMSRIKNICPPSSFSFPREEEFPPTPFPKNNGIVMNEIRNQFSGVAKDFYHVKSKLKLYETLLMVVISLLVINTLMMYFLRPSNGKYNDISLIVKQHDSVIQRIQSEIEGIGDSINKYHKTIKKIQSNIEVLENKITTVGSETKKKISTEEIDKRQKELIKAGYEITNDGKWGDNSIKAWDDYQNKKNKEK